MCVHYHHQNVNPFVHLNDNWTELNGKCKGNSHHSTQHQLSSVHSIIYYTLFLNHHVNTYELYSFIFLKNTSLWSRNGETWLISSRYHCALFSFIKCTTLLLCFMCIHTLTAAVRGENFSNYRLHTHTNTREDTYECCLVSASLLKYTQLPCHT